jgi:pimeloyl-ACP methyl ester carboxylesterase
MKMATYILVHGAWHGSWCWKRVRNSLRAEGHQVFTPTLTGLGERSHLGSSSVGMSTHIADIVNLIKWEELSDIILCGHSYGGCVISGVADRIHDQIRTLVYVDAFVLEDGECLMDLYPQEQVEAARQQAKTTGDGWKVDPLPASLYHTNEKDLNWVDNQCTAQPIETFEERIALKSHHDLIKDVVHILATDWIESPAHVLSHKRAKERGWKTLTMACGHEVMLDVPGQLTELLLAHA